MSNYKQIFSWSLIFLFVFSSAVLSVTNIAKAANDYPPNLFLTVGLQKILPNGDKYSELWLDWTPADNTPSGSDYKWVVNIYDTTKISAHNPENHVVEADSFNYGQRETVYKYTPSINNWVGWNKTFDVILDVRSGDKTIGTITKTIDTSSAPSGLGDNLYANECGVPDLKWYPTAQKEFIHFFGHWNTDKCPSSVTVNMKRPDNSTAEWTNLSTSKPFAAIESKPTSGTYTFTTFDSSKKQIGTTTIDVDLSQGMVQTDQGPALPGTHDYNSINSGNNSNCDCSSKGIGIGYILCVAQCQIINFFATLISTVVNNILLPSLGL